MFFQARHETWRLRRPLALELFLPFRLPASHHWTIAGILGAGIVQKTFIE